jgi:hypothetical protein
MCKPRWNCLLSAAVCVFCVIQAATGAAQVFSDTENPCSPVVSFPTIEGEIKVAVIWSNLLKGRADILTNPTRSFDFMQDWNMPRGAVFVDTMLRLQVGPFSGRMHYNMRSYSGTAVFSDLGTTGDARFDYSGLRFGWDFDPLRWGRSRIGLNMDFDAYSPSLAVGGTLGGGFQVTGPSAMTLGFHAVFTPDYDTYGFSATAEARARWPVTGSEIIDWEIAGGLKAPETTLGTIALRSGYRRTTIEFKNGILFNMVPVRSEVEVVLGGWFGELVYYY